MEDRTIGRRPSGEVPVVSPLKEWTDARYRTNVACMAQWHGFWVKLIGVFVTVGLAAVGGAIGVVSYASRADVQADEAQDEKILAQRERLDIVQKQIDKADEKVDRVEQKIDQLIDASRTYYIEVGVREAAAKLRQAPDGGKGD